MFHTVEQDTEKKRILSSLLPLFLFGFLTLSSGCGREWSVKGSSFPKESPVDRSVSQVVEPKGDQNQVLEPTAPPEKEIDEISRRAEELRQEAEKLARQTGGVREGEGFYSEEGSSSPTGEEREPGKEPEQTAGASGKLLPIPELSDIFFDFDQYLLTEEAQKISQKNAEWLRSHPNARVLIEGHCDERGTVEYNLALGERRAQSVKDYLLNLGISPDRISMISYGKEKPFVAGHSEEAWAQNRRVHFLLRSP
jgi:peptidoglycan-associated lipoprotein